MTLHRHSILASSGTTITLHLGLGCVQKHKATLLISFTMRQSDVELRKNKAQLKFVG